MNPAFEVFSPARAHPQQHVRTQFSQLNGRLLALVMVVLLSAFAVVYLKDLNRRLFIHDQFLQTSHSQLMMQRNKLLLEQTAWSTGAQVQRVATQHLHMVVPSVQDVVMVRGATH